MMTRLSDLPADLGPLEVLIDRVAERQRQDFGQLDSEAKADGSLITACDRWSDATLVQGLAELYPGEGVLSEEGSQSVPGSEAYWVVDPLDGTTNFAAGIPYWAISIARFERGVPVLAVLDVPPLRQRIVARPLYTSDAADELRGCKYCARRSLYKKIETYTLTAIVGKNHYIWCS